MLPNCIKCHSEYTYEDGVFIICPECGFEWQPEVETEYVWKDVNGNILNDGDSVTVIKQLKVKGSSTGIKQGTKIKNIKLKETEDGLHDIDCKIDGIGRIEISSKYVKKI
ncbi:alkylphosphonate utilization protein [Acidaminobacter sp. JC074]|uniref:zinc ribbon domain-containing protein YjdM n=1 Tax=Acidaminobacter sp. JC074 TaxID=2530199 RepID=UPI001F114ABE|nr:zinc ribbon domain-containing protein YjdM [Acidaminobacter sp. JC074]MCH4889853.1 alkylphosphonate utilization protein [Acidaminobacter sp. JC074]